MAIKDKGSVEDMIEWNVDVEVQLFYAMRGHKPVGVNRHFQMACILDKFRQALRKEIGSQQIWDRLETMYDMSALHESEIVPFPNDELEFLLPDREFGVLLRKEENKHNREQKLKESMQKEERERKEEKEKDQKEKTSNSSGSSKNSQNPASSASGKHHHHHHSSHHHHYHHHQDDQKKNSDQNEHKETSKTTKSSSNKANLKDRHRETKEVDSPKRKRSVRGTQEGKSSPKETPPAKRRRN